MSPEQQPQHATNEDQTFPSEDQEVVVDSGQIIPIGPEAAAKMDDIQPEVPGAVAEEEDSKPVEALTPGDSSPGDSTSRASGAKRTKIDAPGKMGKLHLSLETSSLQRSVLKELPNPPPPPAPPADSEKPYLDPTPRTPILSRQPSTRSQKEEYDEKDTQYRTDDGGGGEVFVGKAEPVSDREDTSEIQSIMEQFIDETVAPTKEEIMSPRHEMSGPLLGGSAPFPPRKSSLEPLRSRDMDAIASSPVVEKIHASPPPVPPKPDSTPVKILITDSLTSPSSTSLPVKPPLPEPEPDLPFDFHRFLEQLRHKSADPVAKFLRSFLTEFGKRQFMVHEQVKIIGDFLAFITNKMALCDVWRDVSDSEFDNAKEGMEKLVMNRLYSQTFSPAIPPPPQIPRSKGKRREPEKMIGPGRKGQHQEDVERDEILTQKIRIYSWVREEHLDIPSVGPGGERFLKLAQQELLKIKGYRAPRDKVICVLNCCKVIFGLLKNAKSSDTSADSFVPLLIYVVLQSNPEHLVSNIQYILRFRNQDKLCGEAGYYLSSLSGAIQFIESLDRTTLTVSDEEFERQVEIAVSKIAAQNREAEVGQPQTPTLAPTPNFWEKSTLAQPQLTPRNSMDASSSSPSRRADGRPPLVMLGGTDGSSGGGGGIEENAAVAGLLKTIQRPLSTIGRIFSDQDTNKDRDRDNTTARGTPTLSTSATPARLSPSVFQPPRESTEEQRPAVPPPPPPLDIPARPSDAAEYQRPVPPPPVASYDAQEAAARQASAEVAEARRIERAEHRNVVETLCGMFPNLDKEVIDDVVRQKHGRVGRAVDACLALSAGG